MERTSAYGYFFEEPNKPMARKEFTIDSVGLDEAVVRVAGCGLCHTDVGFYTGQVKTNTLPVVLGHEISGEVIAAGSTYESLTGKNVIVPAVLPCGDCDLCKNGRGNICRRQKMPGNDFDGGFASHLKVPARYLCPLPDSLGDYKVSQLSVVADAVTTPYQSLLRSGLRAGELAVVIGCGGLGSYMVQHAKNVGAKVVGIDIDNKKLEAAREVGADFTINAKDLSERDIKGTVRSWVKENGLPGSGWRVFELSGTAAGQVTAFSLMSFAGTVGIVGFTMDKVTVRLSNIMAFDADVFGNWGCKPEHYPAAVKEVLDGRINVRDNIEEHPLDSINEIFPLSLQHKLEKRVIFVP